jgi:hypothetical protein
VVTQFRRLQVGIQATVDVGLRQWRGELFPLFHPL